MLAKLCSKFSNGTWNENLQIFTLDLEKSKEQKSKLPTSTGSKKKQENSRKNIYFCFIDNAKDFDYMDHNKLREILQEMDIPDHLSTSWEICMQIKKQNWKCSKMGKKFFMLYIVTLLI